MTNRFDPTLLKDSEWVTKTWKQLAQIFDGKLVKVHSIFDTIDQNYETTEQVVDISEFDLKNIEFSINLYLYGHDSKKRKIFSLENIVEMTIKGNTMTLLRECKTYRHEIKIYL